MLPETYTKLLADQTKHFNNLSTEARKRFDEEHARIAARHAQDQKNITEFVARFMETGIFHLSHNTYPSYEKPNRGGGERMYTTLNSLAERITREMKRPFVRLYGDRLRVPKRKNLAVITAHLSFIAEKFEGKYPVYQFRGAQPKNGVVFYPNLYASFDTFQFYGEEGKLQRETFLTYIREPECRRALRVPSL